MNYCKSLRDGRYYGKDSGVFGGNSKTDMRLGFRKELESGLRSNQEPREISFCFIRVSAYFLSLPLQSHSGPWLLPTL